MIFPLPLLLLFVPVVLALLVVRIRAIEGGRHARCLANTARLERELGIGQPMVIKQEALEDFDFAPGVRWVVDDPAAVGYLSESAPPAAQQWGIEHGMVYEEEAREAQALLGDMWETNRAMMARSMYYSSERKRYDD